MPSLHVGTRATTPAMTVGLPQSSLHHMLRSSASAPLLRCKTAPGTTEFSAGNSIEFGGSWASTSVGFAGGSDAGWALTSFPTLGPTQWSINSFGSDVDQRPQTCLPELRPGSRGALGTAGSGMSRRPGTRSRRSANRLSTWDLLGGLSISAEAQNEFAEIALDSLRVDGGPQQGQLEKRKGAQSCGNLDVDLQGFTQTLDTMMSSIEDLRVMHYEFSGERSAPGSPTSKKTATRSRATTGEELDKKRERMDAYKMTRKIEPELPPLQPLNPEESADIVLRDQTIVKRNASPAALQCWSMANRTEGLSKRKQDHTARSQIAACTREVTLLKSQGDWEEVLKRKQKQGRKAAMKRKAASISTPAPPSPAAQWLVYLCTSAFASRLHTDFEHEKAKKKDVEKVVVAPKTAKAKFRDTTRLLMQSVRFGDAASGKSVDLSVLGDKIKSQKVLEESHINITRVHTCLQQWSVAGNLFLCCRKTYRGIVQVQRRWRAWMKWNKDVVARMSKRWERVEQSVITREYQNAGEVSESLVLRMKDQDGKKGRTGIQALMTSNSGIALAPLTLEEKVRLERVPQEDRVTFIRHQLRAMRYFLLPKYFVWEEEVREWHAFYDEQRFSRDAVKTISSHASLESFHWPPMRPTYVPRDGAEGDQLIAEWFQAARKDPKRWTPIPKTQLKFAGAGGRRGRSKEKSNHKPAKKVELREQEETSPFGEVATDEDLRTWGLDLKSMPCLQDGSEAAETPRVHPF